MPGFLAPCPRRGVALRPDPYGSDRCPIAVGPPVICVDDVELRRPPVLTRHQSVMHHPKLKPVSVGDARQQELTGIELFQLGYERDPHDDQNAAEAAGNDCLLGPSQANERPHVTLDTISNHLTHGLACPPLCIRTCSPNGEPNADLYSETSRGQRDGDH